MARKDLIEALQELEQQRRQTASGSSVSGKPAAGESSSSGPGEPSASRAESGGSTAPAPDGAKAIGADSAAPKLQRVTQPSAAAPAAASKTSTDSLDRTGPLDRAGLRALTQPVVLAFLVLAFALGYLLGGGSGSTVQAEPGASGGDLASSHGASSRGGGSTQLAPTPVATPATDGPLFDAANRFTVVAITYDDTPRWREQATETVAHFRAQGLPAHAPVPLAATQALVVLVGAAPTRDALEDLRDRVRSQTDASGRAGQFTDARIYEIASLIGD